MERQWKTLCKKKEKDKLKNGRIEKVMDCNSLRTAASGRM